MEGCSVKAESQYCLFTSAVKPETFIMECGSGSVTLVCDLLQ